MCSRKWGLLAWECLWLFVCVFMGCRVSSNFWISTRKWGLLLAWECCDCLCVCLWDVGWAQNSGLAHGSGTCCLLFCVYLFVCVYMGCGVSSNVWISSRKWGLLLACKCIFVCVRVYRMWISSRKWGLLLAFLCCDCLYVCLWDVGWTQISELAHWSGGCCLPVSLYLFVCVFMGCGDYWLLVSVCACVCLCVFVFMRDGDYFLGGCACVYVCMCVCVCICVCAHLHTHPRTSHVCVYVYV